jgi:hypothetical protein
MNSWTACRMASNLAVAVLERRTSTVRDQCLNTLTAGLDSNRLTVDRPSSRATVVCFSHRRLVLRRVTERVTWGETKGGHQDNAWCSIKLIVFDHVLQLASSAGSQRMDPAEQSQAPC